MIQCGQAAFFVGREVTICGQVKSAMHDTLGQKSGMLLGLCIPYPNQPVMIVIKDEVLPIFPYNEVQWIGKQVCVTGTISTLKGRPYIKVHKRAQLIIN